LRQQYNSIFWDVPFRRNILPTSSGPKNKPSKQPTRSKWNEPRIENTVQTQVWKSSERIQHEHGK
jgi:hypothetical protein